MNVPARKNPLKFILVKGLWYEREKIVYSNFNLNFFHLFFRSRVMEWPNFRSRFVVTF